MLVVAIDADAGSVNRRMNQLRDELVHAEMAPRRPDEQIAHFIPKWSIETWILRLSGRNVDEDTSYRDSRDVDEHIPAGALTFYVWTRPNADLPSHCVPSLREAIPEARRLE